MSHFLKSLRRVLLLTLCVLVLPARAGDPSETALARNRAILQAASAHAEQQPQPVTLAREALLPAPMVDSVQLSPDGKYIAYRRITEQRSELWLYTIDSGQDSRLLANADRLQPQWSGDAELLWLADAVGLAVLDLATRQPRRIYKWETKREQRLWRVDERAPEFALISEKVGSGPSQRYRYLRIDRQGRTTLVHESPLALRSALLRRDGSLAFTAAYDGPRYDTIIRQHGKDSLRELLRCRGIEQCRLIGFDGAGERVTVLSHHREDKLALQQWRANDPRWRVLHRDPEGIADAGAVLWPPGSDDWLAIAYHSDRRHWHGRDKRIQAQLNALQARMQRAYYDLDSSADGRRWLLQAHHATWPQDRYYLYEPERDLLKPMFLADRAAVANPSAPLAEALPVRYRASDGWLLHGYVYLPRGVPLSQAPLIAMLHGGPFNRVKDEFDPFVQLLVNRGNVVFAPNFRASTGYGLRHVLAAKGDFGNGRVLADIIDGLDTLLAQGIGDRQQQAVIGHSFGGYASLLAVSHHRQRFRFAVASAAPAEFAWSMRWIEQNGGSALPSEGPPGSLFLSHFGVPTSDPNWRQSMQRDSPLAQTTTLATPIYLWAGAQDDRIPIQSIVRYAADARRNGVSTTLLIDPESGHNPHQVLALEAMVYLVELAAHRHFGSALTPPSAALQRFLGDNLRLQPDSGLRAAAP